MKKRDDVATVLRLMSMVKYLSKFLGDLSQICEPIRCLTHRDVLWNWTRIQDEALDKIKKAVTSAPVLAYFDSTKPTEGSGDASSQGVRFLLTQEDHPVTYASRGMTQASRTRVCFGTQPSVRLRPESSLLYGPWFPSRENC